MLSIAPLAKAQEKDLGLQPFFMAGALLQVRHLRHLPAITPSLSTDEGRLYQTQSLAINCSARFSLL